MSDTAAVQGSVTDKKTLRRHAKLGYIQNVYTKVKEERPGDGSMCHVREIGEKHTGFGWEA